MDHEDIGTTSRRTPSLQQILLVWVTLNSSFHDSSSRSGGAKRGCPIYLVPHIGYMVHVLALQKIDHPSPFTMKCDF